MANRETLVAGTVVGFSGDVGAAVWRLQDARDRTLRVLDDVAEEHLDRHAHGNTIGTILYHVALIEADWLYTEILEQPVPDHIARLLPADDRDEKGILTVVRSQSLAAHTARLQAVRDALVPALRGMSSEEFHRVRRLPNYDVAPAWVLHHLAQHEAEHRGEIGSALALFKTLDQAAPSG